MKVITVLMNPVWSQLLRTVFIYVPRKFSLMWKHVIIIIPMQKIMILIFLYYNVEILYSPAIFNESGQDWYM